MENKPLHFDGSMHNAVTEENTASEPFILTDEMRKNISGNPHVMGPTE
ncbi:hypothetical protein [Litchfieldia alkalitelluris]|nr:hypothetical protein [Litchfieldia alkalitelluris]